MRVCKMSVIHAIFVTSSANADSYSNLRPKCDIGDNRIGIRNRIHSQMLTVRNNRSQLHVNRARPHRRCNCLTVEFNPIPNDSSLLPALAPSRASARGRSKRAASTTSVTAVEMSAANAGTSQVRSLASRRHGAVMAASPRESASMMPVWTQAW